MTWVPVESEAGVAAQDMRPGMTFTYERAEGQEFWTVVRAAPVGEIMNITYLIVSSTGVKIREFSGAKRDQILWAKVLLWKKPG